MFMTTTLRLRYVGDRFINKRLPVDVLVDLPAFRELLVAFAKNEWRKKNEDRKRVPRGFDASLAFDLIGIEDGSAVPVLEWNREITQSRLPGFADQIEDVVKISFEKVVKLFDDASFGKFPTAMAQEQIRALNKFGANLKDNEKIEFEGMQNSDGNVVYLSSDIRKRLIGSLQDRYVSQITDVGRLLGSVADAERDLGHIRISSERYGTFDIPLDNETIKNEFDGNIDQPLEINLTAQLDHDDRVKCVTEVHNVSLIDEHIAAHLKRCKDRLTQISRLLDGWHDGEGAAPTQLALNAANTFLIHRVALCEHYRIFPTDEGGVVFEIDHKGLDLSVEFLSNGRVKIYGVEIEGDATVDEIEFDSTDEELGNKFNELMK